MKLVVQRPQVHLATFDTQIVGNRYINLRDVLSTACHMWH